MVRTVLSGVSRPAAVRARFFLITDPPFYVRLLTFFSTSTSTSPLILFPISWLNTSRRIVLYAGTTRGSQHGRTLPRQARILPHSLIPITPCSPRPGVCRIHKQEANDRTRARQPYPQASRARHRLGSDVASVHMGQMEMGRGDCAGCCC